VSDQRFSQRHEISYCGLKLPRVSAALVRCYLRSGADLPQVAKYAIAAAGSCKRVPDRFAASILDPPEQKALDDFAQLLLSFLRREEGGAGGWQGGLQDGQAIARAVGSRACPDRRRPVEEDTSACAYAN
jgi:hypothetical protein